MKKVGSGVVFDGHFTLIYKAAFKDPTAQSSGQFLVFFKGFVKLFLVYA
jgi:hypothetical protein